MTLDSSAGRRTLFVFWSSLLAILCMAVSGADPRPPASSNTVADFLSGAELQAETNHQRREVLRGLNDILADIPGDPENLKRLRYADDEGNPGRWTIVMLLMKHFVPLKPASLTESDFFKDIGAASAQAAVREQRSRILNRAR